MNFRLSFLLMAIAHISMAGPAQACACCAEEGHRYVEKDVMEDFEREVISTVIFEQRAHTSWDAEPYDQQVRFFAKPDHDGLNFTLTLKDGRSANISFKLPREVSRFEVDPRDPAMPQAVAGGPIIYKEWKLISAAVGDGFLSPVLGAGQDAALILQGRGNACPNRSDFNAWTLVIYGPKGEVTTFGLLRGDSLVRSAPLSKSADQP